LISLITSVGPYAMLSAIVSVVIIRILKMLTVPDVMIMVTMRMKMKYDD